jgi:6-phosphogluconate dehydrogenase
MQVGLIGLGRMGAGMAQRWHAAGYDVVAYNRTVAKAEALAARGVVTAVNDLKGLVEKLTGPRVVYVMVPAGEVTEDIILGQGGLMELLQAGDVVVDAGNSHYPDSVRRAKIVAQHGIELVDQGTSGGILGATQGYCVMVGGVAAAVALVEPFARSLAMENGYIHAGEVGAGHYVKMIHNGMEYGMMQSLAEGFNLLHEGPYAIDLADLAKTWQHGSILQSLLLEVLTDQLREHGTLEHVSPQVSDSGEGQWTVEEALQRKVPVPAITAALFARYDSRKRGDFAGKVLAAMRLGFGGHTS